MSRSRLVMARWMGRLLPPILSNRLTIHHLYPFESARREGGEVRRRAITGSPFRVNLDDSSGYIFAMHGYFDWRVTAVAGAVLRPGDIALDVGANVGTETIALADLVGPKGKVYAIEALPRNLNQLERLHTESHLDQVEILPLAVSEQEGTIEFSPPEQEGHSGIGHIRTEGDKGPSITVPCKTLDNLFQDIRPIKFITMDIEGAEYGVLRSGGSVLRRDRPVMVMEACESHLRRFGHGLADVHDTLKELGYRIYQIAKMGLTAVDLKSETQTNWVAIPEGPEAEALAGQIGRRLFTCALLPCIPGVSPLTRVPTA